MSSLDFTLNRFFIKLFKTSHMEIVKYCQSSVLLKKATWQIYWKIGVK